MSKKNQKTQIYVKVSKKRETCFNQHNFAYNRAGEPEPWLWNWALSPKPQTADLFGTYTRFSVLFNILNV